MGLLQGLEQAGSQPVAHQKQGCVVPGKLRISFSRLMSKACGAISYGIVFHYLFIKYKCTYFKKICIERFYG